MSSVMCTGPKSFNVSEFVSKYDAARAKLGIDSSKFNCACVGLSGSGKSSLVNALRGVSDNDPRAARVGEVETTTIATPYQHPSMPDVVLWDVPGAGTLSQPVLDYFENSMLYAFDVLVLVTTRASEADHKIIGEFRFIYGAAPIAVVRSQADLAIKSKMRRSGVTAQQCLDEVRSEFVASMDPGPNFFVVSAWAFTDPSLPRADENNLLQFIMTKTKHTAPIVQQYRQIASGNF